MIIMFFEIGDCIEKILHNHVQRRFIYKVFCIEEQFDAAVFAEINLNNIWKCLENLSQSRKFKLWVSLLNTDIIENMTQ